MAYLLALVLLQDEGWRVLADRAKRADETTRKAATAACEARPADPAAFIGDRWGRRDELLLATLACPRCLGFLAAPATDPSKKLQD